MRKRKPPEPQSASLRPEEMRAALPRLRKRIEELRAVNVNEIQQRVDPDLRALEQKVKATLSDVFGPGTIEYQQFGRIYFDQARMTMYGPAPLHQVREGYARGIAQAISSLEAVVELFEEKLGPGNLDSASRARHTLAGLDLHTELARAVVKLFEDGHYSNAVEDACKVLDSLVKLRSGRHDLSGTDLMLTVFSPNSPILRFNDLTTDSGQCKQRGMMFLFSGVMLALRNPRAHAILEDDADTALEYIAFIDLLVRALDRTSRV